jgi:hypothetical protein
MHAVVLLCPYSDSQSSELLSSDTSNPQHKTAHPHHHCLSTPSLPMTARKMIHSIPGPYSKSIIPPRITASAANACGSLLTPKSKAPRKSTVASLGIVREALPILASGDATRTNAEVSGCGSTWFCPSRQPSCKREWILDASRAKNPAMTKKIQIRRKIIL